jgi:hypothetical protein
MAPSENQAAIPGRTTGDELSLQFIMQLVGYSERGESRGGGACFSSSLNAMSAGLAHSTGYNTKTFYTALSWPIQRM